MATKESNKAGFIEGKQCFVWKQTGVRDGKNGPTSSERIDQDYPNIETTEPLTVLKKYGSTKALCRRPDGSELVVHINHINSTSAYYTTRSKEGKLSTKDQLAKATAEAETAMAKLKLAEEAANEPAIDEADQDEAAALFEADAG